MYAFIYYENSRKSIKRKISTSQIVGIKLRKIR